MSMVSAYIGVALFSIYYGEQDGFQYSIVLFTFNFDYRPYPRKSYEAPPSVLF